MIRTALIFSLMLGMMSCQSRKQTSGLPNWVNNAGAGVVLVQYEKTPCFGACPAFTFTWHADGSVKWEGKHFVERMGTHYGRLDNAKFARVLAVVDRIGYTQMEATYDNKMVTDLPSTTTEILGEQGHHSVRNRYKGPESLNELYQELDALIQEVTWAAPANSQ